VNALDLRCVSYAYEDGTPALRSIDFSLEEGEKVAVLGANGAGKSTLLHLIAGFRMPFSGSVSCYGRALDESSADEIRRNVGLVFQDPDDQLFMPTVKEDVAFGPRNLGLSDLEGRVARSLRGARIEAVADRNPLRLSHGLKKRVALAGTLAMDMRLLLLDEPTSGLDPRSRAELIGLLRGIRRTMLIATHDLEAAITLADSAVVLNEGIAFKGTMMELIESRDVLIENGLEVPAISRLRNALSLMGHDVRDLPLSLEQAIEELPKYLGRRTANEHRRR
jgi:energy-coupling factor transporter ATP-binding protein EcfA2